ncbi:MAG: glycosyltransferase family 2 protein [Candidatus Omnitrophota bacterium]
MQPKVFIIILNWNNKEDTRECILSLRGIDYENYNIVVVDNASTDNSVQFLKANFPDTDMLINSENLGYAGGNNVGIRYALKEKCDFILLLNNDVVVSRDFLKILVNTAAPTENIGIAGPLIYYHKTQKINFAGVFFSKKSYEPVIRGYRNDDAGEFNNAIVDYVSGACILIKSFLFEYIGLLDEDYFILWEESDFCLRAKKKGYKSLFISNSFIWHKESVTFGNNDSPRYLYYSLRNKLLFLKKNVPASRILRLKTTISITRNIIAFLKRHNQGNNLKKARACFSALCDYYFKKFGKGPDWLYV